MHGWPSYDQCLEKPSEETISDLHFVTTPLRKFDLTSGCANGVPHCLFNSIEVKYPTLFSYLLREFMKRGMIITSKVEIDQENNSVKFRPEFSQKALRYGVLYLDEICVAQTSLFQIGLPVDWQQLKKEKIVNEIIGKPSLSGTVDFAKAALDAYSQSFSELNKRRNETWCLNKEFKFLNDRLPFIDCHGETLTFLNALPVPTEDFPIGDLYEFRIKRDDERKELMNSIDRLRLNVLKSEDKHNALKVGLLDVESNLITMNRLIKETKRGFYLTDFSLDYSSKDMLEVFKGTYEATTTSGFDKLSALILSMGASLASGFNFKGGYRYKQAKPNSPYFYAAEIVHKFDV